MNDKFGHLEVFNLITHFKAETERDRPQKVHVLVGPSLRPLAGYTLD